MKLVWSREASERLAEIESHVAADKPDAEIRVIERIVERARSLREFPQLGRRVPELPASNLRELIEGNYRIVYRQRDQLIEIVTVFDGRRLFRGEEGKP